MLGEELFDEDGDARPPRERPAWLVPALLAGLVVVLLLGAYGIGRVVSGNLAGTDVKQAEPDGVVIGEDGSTGASGSAQPSKKPAGKPYAGATDTARIGGASATCQSGNGVDSAGNLVSYSPGNVYDEDMTTAWRCDGDGSGQQLTVDLAGKTQIGEVGLVPGYAKTDVRSGIDRYAENDRITRVRWVFDDGTTVEQKFDPAVSNRSMQSMRIPVTKASKVVVEVLDSQRGDPQHDRGQRAAARRRRPLNRAQASGASSTSVIGPSLTRRTCMSAPNAPRATVAPSRSSSAHTCS